jgi:hypothetical protein
MFAWEPSAMTIPETIAGRFRMEALERDPASMAAIAPDGEIGWVNPGWLRFARANGGADAAIRVGDNYFAAIRGEVRGLFERAVTNCLTSGAPREQDYECSSANERRAFRLRMLPLSGRTVLLVHSLVAARSDDRTAEPPDEARYRDDNGLLAQCSNCRRTRSRDASWHWVPAWVQTLPQGVTHVLCPVCRGFYWPPEAANA